MANAKKEIIDHIGTKEVIYVSIKHGRDYDEDQKVIEGKLEDIIERLDFKYDDGYGGQELFGTIWYADGTWSDRREYDGSEWWEHHVCPSIPVKGARILA